MICGEELDAPCSYMRGTRCKQATSSLLGWVFFISQPRMACWSSRDGFEPGSRGFRDLGCLAGKSRTRRFMASTLAIARVLLANPLGGHKFPCHQIPKVLLSWLLLGRWWLVLWQGVHDFQIPRARACRTAPAESRREAGLSHLHPAGPSSRDRHAGGAQLALGDVVGLCVRCKLMSRSTASPSGRRSRRCRVCV